MNAKFKVGDRVIVEASYNERRYCQKSWEDTVDKVGRKYFYLHGDGRAYDVFSGRQKPTQYSGSERSVYAPDEWFALRRLAQVTEALQSHEIRPTGFGGFKQPLPVLERLLAVLEES